MGVFMYDFSGRCWSTLPGRCGDYSVEVPSWPGALRLQQCGSERKIIYCVFPQALLAWALCHTVAPLWSWRMSSWLGAWCEFTSNKMWFYSVSPSIPNSLIQTQPQSKGWFPFASLVFISIKPWSKATFAPLLECDTTRLQDRVGMSLSLLHRTSLMFFFSLLQYLIFLLWLQQLQLFPQVEYFTHEYF